MQSLIHADIFFFVTTVALILISICLTIALIYIIRILRNIFEVSNTVKSEGAEIISDIREISTNLREKTSGVGFGVGLSFLKRLFSSLNRRRKRKNYSSED